MAKILYPVGTLVQVVDNIKIDDNFSKHDIPIGTIAKVTRYYKGSKHPYRIEGYNQPLNVKELKRYTPKSPKKTTVEQSKSVEEKQQIVCQCDMSSYYTKEEVDVLLAHQWKDILEMLSNVDGVATEALRNTHMIADVIDSNFRKVAKQFKTLNHDDD